MNFNQLKYICAVAQTRNFSKAAVLCDVAQSTLSKEIQRLEKEFDILIFDRTRQPVTPTLKGEDLLAQAQKILAGQQEFIRIARKKTNTPQGDFSLGIQNIIAPYLLPLFVNRLSAYPKLKVALFELSQNAMLRRFENGKLDAALIIAPFKKEGFYETEIFRENFVLYLGESHPLLKRKEIDWQDIPLEELLLHQNFKSHLISSGILANKDAKALKALKNTSYRNGSLETLRKVIDRNGGLTFLPELSTRYMGERRLRLVRKVVHPIPYQMIALVTPRGFEKRRITKVIREEILNGIKK